MPEGGADIAYRLLERPRSRTIRDNVAAAAKAAEKLPSPQGGTLLDSAQDAFVSGMSAVAFICAALAALTTVLVIAFLPAREKNNASLKTADAPSAA
ncbi:hypothetical protein [Streptomyces sp. NPDC002082]|uniref:hypothetical protein n=1 Tax=Streptomyces sp. NPDC002082 TaxID=3154772 RepID=UPI00331ED9FC